MYTIFKLTSISLVSFYFSERTESVESLTSEDLLRNRSVAFFSIRTNGKQPSVAW